MFASVVFFKDPGSAAAPKMISGAIYFVTISGVDCTAATNVKNNAADASKNRFFERKTYCIKPLTFRQNNSLKAAACNNLPFVIYGFAIDLHGG